MALSCELASCQSRPGRAGLLQLNCTVSDLECHKGEAVDHHLAGNPDHDVDLMLARFTHKTIVDHVDPPRGKYGQQSFRDFLYDIVHGHIPVTELRPMRICLHNGEWWSFDNHRLYAIKLLNHLRGILGSQHPCAKQAIAFPFEIVSEHHRAARKRMFRSSSRKRDGHILPAIRETGRFGSFYALGHFLALPGSQVLHLHDGCWVPKACDEKHYILDGVGQQT